MFHPDASTLILRSADRSRRVMGLCISVMTAFAC